MIILTKKDSTISRREIKCIWKKAFNRKIRKKGQIRHESVDKPDSRQVKRKQRDGCIREIKFTIGLGTQFEMVWVVENREWTKTIVTILCPKYTRRAKRPLLHTLKVGCYWKRKRLRIKIRSDHFHCFDM